MARLWSSGFELNATATGVDLDLAVSSPFSISTLFARSGTYALRLNPAVNSANNRHQFASSNQTSPLYFRTYIYINSSPTGTSRILGTFNSGFAEKVAIKITSANKLQLWDIKNAVQVGSDSSALNTSQWYRIELKVNTTTIATTAIDGQIDGVSFASGIINLDTGITYFYLGNNSENNTFDIFYDDVAINDSTGSFQNSYPGSGKIIYLRPNAAGDSTQWTPDTGNNYARVNEVTPDDATSLVSDVILNDSDLYNVDNSGIGSSDTVNVVQLGVRFRNDVADATTAFKVQIEKASGGTISQSSAITPNSTTWRTNATAAPFNYPLTLYQDPDSSNWTKTTLDSMQIGVKSTLIGVNKNQVSTIWALVDYTPATGPAVTGPFPTHLRV